MRLPIREITKRTEPEIDGFEMGSISTAPPLLVMSARKPEQPDGKGEPNFSGPQLEPNALGFKVAVAKRSEGFLSSLLRAATSTPIRLVL